jgi:hypothetical protein
MTNPRIRPTLHFYTEDAGAELNEARQAKYWLKELGPELPTPVVRLHNQFFFFNFEPTSLSSLHPVSLAHTWQEDVHLSLVTVTHEMDCGFYLYHSKTGIRAKKHLVYLVHTRSMVEFYIALSIIGCQYLFRCRT